jgi:hypothetical protein
MRSEPPIAFVAEPREQTDVEIRINFGVFAGREATPAELDDLGRAAMERVDHVTVVSEHRHELGTDSETSLHQVRMRIPQDSLPGDGADAALMRDRLVALAEKWAQSCFEARHADVVEFFPGDRA